MGRFLNVGMLIGSALVGCRGEAPPATPAPEAPVVLAIPMLEEVAPTLVEPAMIGAVVIEPSPVQRGVGVHAKVTTEPGLMLRYEWEINGAGQGRQVSADFRSEYKRGDKLRVIVHPAKDGIEGLAMASDTVVVSNSPPVYTGVTSGGFQLDGHVFAMEDPDGDAIRYALQGAPPGLRIDRSTGTLSWTPPKKAKGKTSYEVVMTAEDGHGGEVKITFPVHIEGT